MGQLLAHKHCAAISPAGVRGLRGCKDAQLAEGSVASSGGVGAARGARHSAQAGSQAGRYLPVSVCFADRPSLAGAAKHPQVSIFFMKCSECQHSLRGCALHCVVCREESAAHMLAGWPTMRSGLPGLLRFRRAAEASAGFVGASTGLPGRKRALCSSR
jgi:hypothetical protein